MIYRFNCDNTGHIPLSEVYCSSLLCDGDIYLGCGSGYWESNDKKIVTLLRDAHISNDYKQYDAYIESIIHEDYSI